ncbi:MAG: hypothetical protein WBQ08_07295 [Candidatus Sulfotelmatobacter sp.]
MRLRTWNRKFVLQFQDDQITGSQPQSRRAISVLIYIAILHLPRGIEGIAQREIDLQTAIATAYLFGRLDGTAGIRYWARPRNGASRKNRGWKCQSYGGEQQEKAKFSFTVGALNPTAKVPEFNRVSGASVTNPDLSVPLKILVHSKS